VTDAILEATVALAAEGGLEDLTMDAIAERAGIGRPTIYRRWASKEELLTDAIDMMVTKYATIVPESGNVRDELVAWARVMIERVQSPLRSLWLAYFNLEEAHVAADALKRAHDHTTDLVRRAVERGELRSDADPDLLIQLIFAMLWYQVTSHHRHLKPEYAETVVDAVLNSWWPEAAAGSQKSDRRQRRPESGPDGVSTVDSLAVSTSAVVERRSERQSASGGRGTRALSVPPALRREKNNPDVDRSPKPRTPSRQRARSG